jgi:hypothetical protein
MKLNKYRRVLVSLSLVLFLGFGWSDSLRLLFDYLFLGSIPAATEQVGKEETSAPLPGQARPVEPDSVQCPGCPRPRPPGFPPPTL